MGHVDCSCFLFRIVLEQSLKRPRVLFWFVPAWSLKNREVFRIGCVDCPCLLFQIVPTQSLKNTEEFEIGPKYFVQILGNAIIRTCRDSHCLPYAGFFSSNSFWVKKNYYCYLCYYLHRLKDSVSFVSRLFIQLAPRLIYSISFKVCPLMFV